MTLQLRQLLLPWAEAPEQTILGLSNDSRRVKPGDLFLAYPGHASDGRAFITQAVKQGAAAVAYDPAPGMPSLQALEVPCISIPHLGACLAAIACRFYDNPTEALHLTGVTGTNGKTTIAYQLAQAYQHLGSSSAYVGTLGEGHVDALRALSNTTPDALQLQRLFFEYRQTQVHHVCMEVSSHALTQGRVDGIPFKQAVFTNLTLDHLDYHRTMEAYAEAKARLFATPGLETAIINTDDAYAATMLASCPSSCQTLSYGMLKPSDVQAMNVNVQLSGNQFDVKTPWGRQSISCQTLGYFNVYNTLAVITSLCVNAHSLSDVANMIPRLKAAPGRMEVVMTDPCVIVDYAHTPDALNNVLETLYRLREHQTPSTGKLWVIVGCGGDRDTSKRPLMARVASQWSDRVVMTSDNPRSEDPNAIINDMMKGIADHNHVVSIIDRKEAIHYALERAEKEDVILIAGKGHEDYQLIGQKKLAFSDRQVVQAFFNA